MTNSPLISIVIIGYNTSLQLKQLLVSINNLKAKKNEVEIIYIDDGSTDSSFKVFTEFKTRHHKVGKQFSKNMGRVEATQKGILKSSGKWLLFVRSNEYFHENILKEYLQAIESNLGVAYLGSVNYKCHEKKFEKYLNSSKRGIKLFSNKTSVHFRYLLFNNSLIHNSIFKKITLNKNFKYYGGEELEFSYRLDKNYPNKIIAWPSAQVSRTLYPDLKKHCQRLEEFGSLNFLLLKKNLKKEVIKFNFLIRQNNILLKTTNALFLNILLGLYSINNNNKINYYIIRACFLASILRGFYNASKFPDSKSSTEASSHRSD